MSAVQQPELSAWRQRLFVIIFEADTPAGKAFDVGLILGIVVSVAVVMLDSVESLQAQYGSLFYTLEWFFTGLFTVEYLLRLACVGRPLGYAKSFFGVVDLLAILPTYLNIIAPGTRYLLVIRVLRVLRVFRILKLVQYLEEASLIHTALKASARKIFVFLFTVITLVVVLGSIMYLIEGPENGFTSIPRSVYWAIVTLTTVGYGDITPETTIGQVLASLVMIIGFSIIAVPTGIITAEFSQATRRRFTRTCQQCSGEGHDPDAGFCKYCGETLS